MNDVQGLYEAIISTHTPLAGRDGVASLMYRNSAISTHTPLAGRDAILSKRPSQASEISTHTPLAGRDQYYLDIACLFAYFYSHAPRGARQGIAI